MSLPLKQNEIDTSIRSNDDIADFLRSTGQDILESDLEDEVLAMKTRLVNDVGPSPLQPGLVLTRNRQTTSSAGRLSTGSSSSSTALAMLWTRC